MCQARVKFREPESERIPAAIRRGFRGRGGTPPREIPATESLAAWRRRHSQPSVKSPKSCRSYGR